MSLVRVLKHVEKLIVDNSPVILTAIGVTGTITTAYLTGKATVKAVHILEEEASIVLAQQEEEWPLPTKRKLELVWKLYVPAVGTAVFTIAAIVAANRIGTRRAAAMAAAYSLSEKAFHEYKEKVVEQIGKNKEEKIRTEIVQDRVDARPVSGQQVIVAGTGKVLCFESITGRYFESDMEALRRAQNDLNHTCLNNGYATLHEFYELIGLPPTKYASEVGWTSAETLELTFSAVLAEDGRPCIAIEYNSYPIRDYY